MAVTALTFNTSLVLDWVTSFDESSEVHSEAFVLYDGTTKYAPIDKAGKTLSFGGIQKGKTMVEAMADHVGTVATLTYLDTGSNTSMTITDCSYTFRAYDGTNYYYDWSITFGESQ